MIEMISMANWVYLRTKLYEHYQKHITESWDGTGGPTFRRFVEDVFNVVLKWNQFSDQVISLNIINEDSEFALDLLDAIPNIVDPDFQSNEVSYNFIYLDNIGAGILEKQYKLDTLAEECSVDDYSLKIETIRHNKLIIVARLLNVLRQSKDRG